MMMAARKEQSFSCGILGFFFCRILTVDMAVTYCKTVMMILEELLMKINDSK